MVCLLKQISFLNHIRDQPSLGDVVRNQEPCAKPPVNGALLGPKLQLQLQSARPSATTSY